MMVRQFFVGATQILGAIFLGFLCGGILWTAVLVEVTVGWLSIHLLLS